MDTNDEVVRTVEGEVLPHLPTGKLGRGHLRRIDVVQAFHTAFQMIGGVPRLALWADANPTEFYKLYGRLLPSAAQSELAEDPVIEIRHALGPPKYNPASEPLALPEKVVNGDS